MSNKPSLRARKKSRTWDAIASAAWKLIAKQGYEATTLEQIAEIADVHKQTVLRYFKTKEEIALAYQVRMLDEFEKGLFDPKREGDVIDYWRAYVKSSAALIKDNGNALLTRHNMIRNNPKLAAHALTVLQRYETALERAFSEEAGHKGDSDLHAMLLAAFLVAGNNRVVRRIIERKELDKIERVCLSVVDYAKEKLSGPTARFPKLAGRNGRASNRATSV